MAEKEVSAIGYSIVANVVDNRQITFQHFIASDATDDQVNRDIDRIMRLIDRQAKLLSEPALHKERRDLEASIKQYGEDLAKVEADWQAAQDALAEQISELDGKAKDAHDTAYKAHVDSGRVAAFEPRGQTLATIKNCAADIARIKQTMENNVAERGQARQSLEIAMKARRNRLEIIDAELAEIEGVKGG